MYTTTLLSPETTPQTDKTSENSCIFANQKEIKASELYACRIRKKQQRTEKNKITNPFI